MSDLIRKYKPGDNGIHIYQAHEIASWFEMSEADIPEPLQRPFTVIKELILIPKANQDEAISSISHAFKKLVEEKEFVQPSNNPQDKIEIIQQPFSDKIILKGSKFVQTLARDGKTNEFDFLQANLSEAPT